MKRNANLITVTSEQLKSAGINPGRFMGKYSLSATIDADKFMAEILMDRGRNYDARKVAKKLGVKDFDPVLWGSDRFWSLVPDNVNAVTMCSRGKVTYHAEVSGIYHNFSMNGEDMDSRHWFWDSVHRPIDTDVRLPFTVDLGGPDNYRFDTDQYHAYRPGAKRLKLNLKDVDWDIVPDWCDVIRLSTEEKADWTNKKPYKGGYVPGGYFKSPRVTFTNGLGYGFHGWTKTVNGNQRPCEDAHDPCDYGSYNYHIVNHPMREVELKRPKKTAKTS